MTDKSCKYFTNPHPEKHEVRYNKNMSNYIPLFARLSLFLIYGWFGMLKVLGYSPAGPMVADLLRKTIPFMEPATFIVLLGVFEVVIGVLFLIPQLRKITLTLFFVHMFTTFGPLVLLPELAWTSTLVPTLEGQYIIKNLALISTVLFLYRRQY
jgi:uncharacterized membrane protein YkgB